MATNISRLFFGQLGTLTLFFFADLGFWINFFFFLTKYFYWACVVPGHVITLQKYYKWNYKFEMKELPILWAKEWTNSTALKPFLIISGCLQKYSYTSQIHAHVVVWAQRVNDTLKLAGFMPLTGFFVTSSTNETL